MKKRAKQETDEWLVNGAASDSVRRIVQERNVLRASHDETATERQVGCEYNIKNDEGRTETHQTTGRGTHMNLSR